MIFGTHLCKWILITLVNLLHCVPCTSLTWWRNVDITEIMPFTMHVTLSPCYREMPSIYPSRDVATQFTRFESGGLQHLEYPSREVLPFADPWCEGVERTSADRVDAAGSHHHHAIVQWHSRLVACARMNGGHFEHKFWASLLCFVCFINTDFRKCDWYKYVQSANIVWNVLLLCLTLSHDMVAK